MPFVAIKKFAEQVVVFHPGIIPIPKSRDSGKFSNPEIPGLRSLNPGIMKLHQKQGLRSRRVDIPPWLLKIILQKSNKKQNSGLWGGFFKFQTLLT